MLSRMFTEMGLQKMNRKHLDLFQDIKGKELQKQALQTYDLSPPDNMLLDFDFENRVIIMKNKVTKQMIIMFGSEHYCEQSISFGKQLIDTFKPKTLFIEDTPLEECLQESHTDEKGITYPGLNKIIDRVSSNDMKLFIEGSIIQNTDMYKVDTKNNIVYKTDNQGLPIKLASDLPTYAMYHLHKHQTSAAQASTLD